jgi:hypothetical protein
MTRDTLNALADRCERATGPSMDLDWDIATAVWNAPERRYESDTPCVTHSLDAAMSLVPEGHQFGAGRDNLCPGPEGWAWISDSEDYTLIRAATPALALSAAALRSRAADKEDG